MRPHRFASSLILATLVAALAWPGRAHSQAVTTAGITGQVTDADGQPLSDVQIVVLNEPTGVQRGVLSRGGGWFDLRGLRPGGPYRIEARLIGYGTEVVESVQLVLGETEQINFILSPEAVAVEGVEVIASRDQRLDAGVSTTVSETAIESAPTINREITDLARFTPQAFVVNEDDDGAAISIAGQNNEQNALVIDGLVTNDVFGLAASGTNGGQTGAPPISFDALEQIQIAISPYDVTQSGFTGGAINAVTRSGTNEFTGSLYYQFRNESFAGETPGDVPADEREGLPAFSNARYGMRLGGPIVENKLFFFVNGELFRSETPRPFNPDLYLGTSSVEQLELISQVLQEELGYDPGSFGEKASSLDDNKVFAKIDWNINDQHRLAVRHSYSQSDNIDAFASDAFDINYGNNSEVFPNTTNSTALELNSTFGSRYANKLLLGLTYVRDDRDYAGDPFPSVTIDDGSGTILLGSEPFSTGNILNQDIISVTDNFTIFTGRHNITIGTHNEFYDIANLFLRQNFGDYTYEAVDLNDDGEEDVNGVEAFLQSVCAAGSGQSAYCQQLRQQMGGTIDPVPPAGFERGFSLVDDVAGDASNAIGAFNAYQLGFYIQDEFQATDRLRFTAGIRVDIPKITTEPRFAPDVFDTTIPAVSEFYDLNGARPGATPKALPYFAPRLGFSYDVTGTGETQVRGGIGVFTGRLPFVYPGAMFLNNGTTAGFVDTRGTLPNGEPIPFRPDPNNGLTADDFGQDVIPSGELDIFEEDFRYPRVFRTSLGIDHQLPYGVLATLEGQYTKTLDNIVVTNVNLRPQNDFLEGPDNRPVYNYGIDDRFGSFDVGAVLIDPRYTSILKVGNTDEGYTYDITASLEKQFGDNLLTRLAYTYGDAFSVNDLTSDQIASIYQFNPNVNGLNDLGLARSDFSIGSRILATMTYRQEFLSNLATSVSAVYTGESGRPVSYVIGSSFGFTGEGSGTNPLAYIPAEGEELLFADIVDDGEIIMTAAEQAAAFDTFIRNNEYLRSRRGQYAERNGSRAPFEHVVDLSIAQEVFGNVGGRRNTIELTLDIFNFTNLLNRDWGRRYNIGFGDVTLLDFERFQVSEDNDLTPIYTFPLADAGVEDIDEYWDSRILDFGSYGSRWLMQLGVRYSF